MKPIILVVSPHQEISIFRCEEAVDGHSGLRVLLNGRDLIDQYSHQDYCSFMVNEALKKFTIPIGYEMTVREARTGMLNTAVREVLVIGGGTGMLAKTALNKFPLAIITEFEIDDILKEVVKEHAPVFMPDGYYEGRYLPLIENVYTKALPKGLYDIILCDLPFTPGPVRGHVFKEDEVLNYRFLLRLDHALRKGGVFLSQAGPKGHRERAFKRVYPKGEILYDARSDWQFFAGVA